jgi:hypothetical protein
MVKVTLHFCLLSVNCPPGCPPPIHLSSVPWLVSHCHLLHRIHSPCCLYKTRCLLLLSSCHTTSTSHRLEVPPAFKMPPPLVPGASGWLSRYLICAAATSHPLNYLPPLVRRRLPSHWPLVCQLVVTLPLLSRRRRRLSSSQHVTSTLQRAASALQRVTASCLLVPLLSFASLLPAGCHITPHCTAASGVHP